MTISSTVRIAGPFTGNGVTTTFPFTYKVFSTADVQVIRLTISTGVETTLTLVTDYNITLNGNQDSNPGGNIVMVTPLLALYKLTATSDIANLQPTDLTNQGGFYPEVITDALDRATIQIQQLADQTDRAIKIPISDGVLDMTTPGTADRASKYFVYDASGKPSVSSGSGTDTALRTDLANASASLAGSRLSGFRQTGTGAVARTVDAKLKDTVSVKDFGAVGDGVTDDTAAIQAAITAGANKEVYFPSGTYVATSLTISNPCRLFGNGILNKTTTVNLPFITITSNDVDIDGLEFRGGTYNTVPTTVRNQDATFKVYGASSTNPYRRFNFTNLKINGFGHIGIDIRWCENVVVTGCVITYMGYAGVLFESIVNGIIGYNTISFIDAVSGGTDRYGISLSRDPTKTTTLSTWTQNVVVIGNVVTDIRTWTGIDTHAPLNCQILGNIIARCFNGTYVQYDSTVYAYNQPGKNVRIANNLIIGRSILTENGISLASLGSSTVGFNENIIIENNTVIGCGLYSGGGASISLSYTKNGIVRNNTTLKAIGTCLSMSQNCDSCVMENNICDGVIVTTSGSLVADVRNGNTNCLFKNNRFKNTTGDSAYNANYGIFYHTANTGTLFSCNRIDSSSLTGATKQFILDNPGNYNRYTDLKWELETESCAPFTHAAVGGTPRETTASQLANFRRLPATGVSSIYTIQYVRASYTSTNTTFNIAVRPKETTIYDVGVYTVDGTNITAAASITNIYIAIDGIYFND